VTSIVRRGSWPLTYAVAPRILTGIKFLALARMLGPREFGHYSLAYVCLTVMEGVSDFGFRQAIVQNQEDLNRHQLAQVNFVQLLRGLGLIPFVVAAAWLGRDYLKSDFLSVVLISLVPVSRGFYGIPVAIAQRKLDFKGLSGFEISWRAIDTVLCLAAALIWKDSFAVVIASILGEFSGMLVSFLIFPIHMAFARPTSEISPLVKYGRWIWAQTVFTLLLNQFDKFYVTGVSGVRTMGGYRAVNRTMQMIFTDPILTATGILFPKLSQKFRHDQVKAESFNQMLLQNGALFLSTVFLAVIGFRSLFIRIFLGAQWVEFEYLVPVFASTMLLSALIVYMVTWFRSNGRPQVVTWATTLQVAVFLPTVIWWGKTHGAIGVAVANNVALWFTALFMLLAFPERWRMLVSFGIFTLLPVGAFSVLDLQWPRFSVPGMCIFVLIGWYRWNRTRRGWKSPEGFAV